MATLAISMNGDQLRRLASTLQSIAAEMPHPPVTAVVTFDNAPSGGTISAVAVIATSTPAFTSKKHTTG